MISNLVFIEDLKYSSDLPLKLQCGNVLSNILSEITFYLLLLLAALE